MLQESVMGANLSWIYSFNQIFSFLVIFIIHPTNAITRWKIFKDSVFVLPRLPDAWLRLGYSSFWKVKINYSLAFKQKFGMNKYLGRGRVRKWSKLLNGAPSQIFLFLQHRNKETAPFHANGVAPAFLCNIYDQIIFLISLVQKPLELHD